jgi:hypothetical protein
MMIRTLSLVLLCLAPAALAQAQSSPSSQDDPPTRSPSAPDERTGRNARSANSDQDSPGPATPGADPTPPPASAPLFEYPQPDPGASVARPRGKDAAVEGLLFAPTARMLEAGVISSSAAIDTVGGAQLELKIGLGGVAEFGIGSTDHIRVRACDSCDARAVRFVPMARFVMGLPEHRMFRHQPALALGFQKSFTRNHNARSSRYASLYMVASKRLGTAHLHGGLMVWDGVILRGDDSEVALHSGPLSKMIRPYGGFEVLARERSHVLVDLTWNPELKISPNLADPDGIRLRPMLSWGVRYAASRRVALEAGVRVPDIGNANLLDAQIFAQLRFASRAIANAIEDLQGS